MNQWMLAVTVGILLGAMFFLFSPLSWFILGLTGAMITLSYVISIWKLGKRSFPITVNVFTDKRGGIEFDYSKRARRVRQKGEGEKYFLELTTGEKVPDPGRQHQITGDAGVLYNLYTNDYRVFFPFGMKVNKDMKEFEQALIPVQERQWIADQYRINKRLTNKPNPLMEKIMLIAPILIVCIFCGLTWMLFAMGMRTMCGC